MSDLVERLRACHGIRSGDPDCCCEEAAAEIERLGALAAIVREQGFEIAKLRADLKLVRDMQSLARGLQAPRGAAPPETPCPAPAATSARRARPR